MHTFLFLNKIDILTIGEEKSHLNAKLFLRIILTVWQSDRVACNNCVYSLKTKQATFLNGKLGILTMLFSSRVLLEHNNKIRF